MGVRVTGADEAIASLQGVSDRSRDMSPMLAVLRAELEEMVRQSFASQTSPDGTPWTPRAASYRFRDGRPERPRYDSRQGRPLLEDLGRELRLTVEGQSFSIELPEGWAGFHQFGARDLPARPALPVDRAGSMKTGPAGAWWAALPGRIGQYVATGEVTR